MATKQKPKSKPQPLEQASEPKTGVLSELPEDGVSLSELVVDRWAKNPNPGRIVAEVIATFGDRVLAQVERIATSLEKVCAAIEASTTSKG